MIARLCSWNNETKLHLSSPLLYCLSQALASTHCTTSSQRRLQIQNTRPKVWQATTKVQAITVTTSKFAEHYSNDICWHIVNSNFIKGPFGFKPKTKNLKHMFALQTVLTWSNVHSNCKSQLCKYNNWSVHRHYTIWYRMHRMWKSWCRFDGLLWAAPTNISYIYTYIIYTHI